MPKCYFCQKEAVSVERIPVDVDITCQQDENGKEQWTTSTLYGKEWICEDHLREFKNNEGSFDPNKGT